MTAWNDGTEITTTQSEFGVPRHVEESNKVWIFNPNFHEDVRSMKAGIPDTYYGDEYYDDVIEIFMKAKKEIGYSSYLMEQFMFYFMQDHDCAFLLKKRLAYVMA